MAWVTSILMIVSVQIRLKVGGCEILYMEIKIEVQVISNLITDTPVWSISIIILLKGWTGEDFVSY